MKHCTAGLLSINQQNPHFCAGKHQLLFVRNVRRRTFKNPCFIGSYNFQNAGGNWNEKQKFQKPPQGTKKNCIKILWKLLVFQVKMIKSNVFRSSKIPYLKTSESFEVYVSTTELQVHRLQGLRRWWIRHIEARQKTWRCCTIPWRCRGEVLVQM